MELEGELARVRRVMVEEGARARERMITITASKEMCQGQIRWDHTQIMPTVFRKGGGAEKQKTNP